jgi:PHP family Zn ribbon phosphoesterase
MHRVAALADRSAEAVPAGKPPFVSLVGLAEILSEILEKGVKTKTVGQEYFRLLSTYGSELSILMHRSVAELTDAGVPLLPKAIENVRKRTVTVLPGYDGEYGIVRALSDEDKQRASKQGSLF